MRLSEIQIFKLVGLHGPIKARQLASMLSREFDENISKSDVNSLLFKMKSEGKLEKKPDHSWQIVAGQGFQNVDGAGVSEIDSEISKYSAPVVPELVFTAEQQTVINLDPSKHLLIRGQAGSGKTTVLAARAGKILSASGKGSLLFLTYNAALTSYVKELLKKSGIRNEISVQTFHEWVRNAARILEHDFDRWVDQNERLEKVRCIINDNRSVLGSNVILDIEKNDALLNWWKEEIAWIFGQNIITLEEYLLVERIGRGVGIRINQEDRRLVWKVFELYIRWLKEERLEDYDNPAGLVINALTESRKELPEQLRYDHLMIDEVQDFDKSWLLISAKIPRVSLSMAGDLAQKIYRRSFSWSSVGIQVQGGRSRHLSKTHRSTQQIMLVAEYLLVGNTANNEIVPTPDLALRQGVPVRLLIGSNPRSAYDAGYDLVKSQFAKRRKQSVAIVMPFGKQLFPGQKALEKRGLNVRRAKGAALGKIDEGIVVTNFHQLKGLEFDHVVVFGLHDAQYPGRLIKTVKEDDLEDELNLMRRVLYVAMTRAKKSVTLVGANPFCRFFNNVPRECFEILD